MKALIILMLFVSDVRFLYLATGSRDNFRELVDNPETDIITPTSLTTDADITAAITQVTDRIRQSKLSL